MDTKQQKSHLIDKVINHLDIIYDKNFHTHSDLRDLKFINQLIGCKRRKKEIKELLLNPPDGILVSPVTNKSGYIYSNLWIATIHGPPKTPYEGGTFLLNIHIKKEYPFKPPDISFKTRIYHTEINNNDLISFPNYSPCLKLSDLLFKIRKLLSHPLPSFV